MAEAVLTRRSVVKNEYQLLSDITVSGSAVTQIDITGLNIGKGEEIVLVSNILTGDTVFRLYFNNNTTNTNYYRQGLVANGTTISADRANTSTYIDYANTENITNIKLTNNGYGIWQNNSLKTYTSTTPFLHNIYGTTTFTMTSITQLTIKSDLANGIGIGSRFQLYKVGG